MRVLSALIDSNAKLKISLATIFGLIIISCEGAGHLIQFLISIMLMSFELLLTKLLSIFKTILCDSLCDSPCSSRCLSEGKKYLERINDDLIVCVVTSNLILGSLSSLTLKLQGTVNSAILV
mgnify:CR=1 FL=1